MSRVRRSHANKAEGLRNMYRPARAMTHLMLLQSVNSILALLHGQLLLVLRPDEFILLPLLPRHSYATTQDTLVTSEERESRHNKRSGRAEPASDPCPHA